MSKQYWLTIIIDNHDIYPVSHSKHISLCCYVDADGVFSGEDGYHEGPYTDNNKRIVSGLQQGILSGNTQYDFKITKEQFWSSECVVYLWAEPYGSAAFQAPGALGGNLVGRLELSKDSCVAGGLSHPPSSSRPGDEQLLYRVKMGDSVVQFIANEMKKNGESEGVDKMRAALAGPNRPARAQFSDTQRSRGAKAEEILAEYTHATAHPGNTFSDNIPARLQTLYFLGGGQWDHKPQIFATWGTRNRLGNRGYVYYYDLWSNLHFGYIAAAAGIPLHRVVAGAGFAQGADTTSEGQSADTKDAPWTRAQHMLGALRNPPNWRSDDEMKKYLFKDDGKDRRAVINGYNLYGKDISFQSIVRVVSQFPNQWSAPVEDKGLPQ